jgi:ribosomal protein L10
MASYSILFIFMFISTLMAMDYFFKTGILNKTYNKIYRWIKSKRRHTKKKIPFTVVRIPPHPTTLSSGVSTRSQTRKSQIESKEDIDSSFASTISSTRGYRYLARR